MPQRRARRARGRGADRPAPCPRARARRRSDLRLAADRRAPRVAARAGRGCGALIPRPHDQRGRTTHLRAAPPGGAPSARGRSSSPISGPVSTPVSSAPVASSASARSTSSGRVVERAAQVELVVVQRAGGESDIARRRGSRRRIRRPRPVPPPRRLRARPRAGPRPRSTTAWPRRRRSTPCAPSASACARRSGCVVGERHAVPWRARAARATIRPDGAAAEHGGVGRLRRAPACDRVHRRGERLGHRGDGEVQSVGHRVQRRRGRGDAARRSRRAPSVGAQQICGRPARHGAHAPHATESETSTRSPVSARTPGGLVPERARVRREDPVPVAPHLHVGAARRRGLDLDEHLAGLGLRVWTLLHPQVAGAVQDARPSRQDDRLQRAAAALQLERMARSPRAAGGG